jgi:hypothetical protein
MFELFDDSLFGVLLVMLVLTGIAARYWNWRGPLNSSARQTLMANREQATKLQEVFEGLGHGLHNFEGKMRRQLASVEGTLARVSSDLGKVRQGAHAIEKHVGKLEVRSDVAASKLDAISHQVDVDAGALKRIGDQNRDSIGVVNINTLQIDHLEHEVHHLEHEVHVLKLKRIDAKVKSSVGKVDSNARQIDHIEQEVKGLLKHELTGLKQELQGLLRHEVRGLEHPDHYKNGDYENRRRAIAELESANRKIENLMDETIQVEAGYQTHYSWDRNGGLNGMPPAQEFEEHHRKLIDAAQHIFRDVRKHLNRAAVQDMELAAQQIDWSRGELFANPASPEVARAYHQHVKEYFISLKEAISSSLH